MSDAALSGNGTVAVLAPDRIMEQGEDGMPLVGSAACVMDMGGVLFLPLLRRVVRLHEVRAAQFLQSLSG